MSEQKDNIEQKEPKRVRKERPEGMYVPYFLCQKALGGAKDHAKRLLTYCWIYAHNEKTGKGQGEAYGKTSYRKLWQEMEADLGFNPAECVKGLLGMKWIVKHGYTWKGVKMKGYLCMLDKDARLAAKAGQQEMQLDAEGEVVAVESGAKASVDNGEGYEYGYRYYVAADGQKVIVPKLAPPRPSKTAVWDAESEAWTEPEERETGEPRVGIYRIGNRYYYMEGGERHYIPEEAALNPPPVGWVFDDERDCWCRPEDRTEHELDY